ncbi:MAG: histidinol-phosphatase [Solobacterium sp.]|nr:histidinol-phosphatase [Solobacterium sp.]
MIKTNWHTHTARCGHAYGTDEEYVQAAIRGGLKTLGFSDHAAYTTPYPPERMDIEQVPEYIASIRSLKEKYKNQISIHLGMEVEYYPSQWETLTYYRKEMDYLILGQHQLELGAGSVYGIRDPQRLKRYVDALEGACYHGLCDYIAHPDVVLYSYPVLDGSVREAARRIADISLKYDMPLELNCGSGVRYGKQHYSDGDRYAYPVRIFFEEFARRHCPIVIGLDIHNPQLFLEERDLNRALSVIEGLDCNIIEDYDILSAAEKHKRDFF